MPTTPDSTAETSGGDSRYVIGSQPCSGKSGDLIANATTKPRNSHCDVDGPIFVMSNVPCWRPKTMIAASISSEPTTV